MLSESRRRLSSETAQYALNGQPVTLYYRKYVDRVLAEVVIDLLKIEDEQGNTIDLDRKRERQVMDYLFEQNL